MRVSREAWGHKAACWQEVAVTLSLVTPSAPSWTVGVDAPHCSPLMGQHHRAGSGLGCPGLNEASGCHPLSYGRQHL